MSLHSPLKALVAILLALTLVGCPLEGDDADLINGEYVFEIEYVNTATGYENNGRFINSAGEVWSYQAPGDYGQTLASLDLTIGIPLAALEEKYATSFMVNVIELPAPLDRYTLLDKAFTGGVEPVDGGGTSNDFGVYTIRGFLFDRRHDTYREIMLLRCGDIAERNTSAAAEALLDRLARQITLPCELPTGR